MSATVEDVKRTSSHLRGDIAEELQRHGEAFGGESLHLLKFHGIYQQDDRDRRRELARARQPLAHSCMVRCSVPGGRLSREQWTAIDGLADAVGDGSLRLTTRQGVQYHFVHKGDLRPLISTLEAALVSTYAACGDVVRNVMASNTPFVDTDLGEIDALAVELARRFRPASNAYWELWIDGDRAVTSTPTPEAVAEIEPLYGETYLPRKFKIGIAAPGDNSIDVYTQDVGLVPATVAGVRGAVVLAGGGLGRSHKDPTTFPRLAEPLAWVPNDELGDVVEAVVATFRDHGDREDRRHARLKYLVEARGIGWLREEVEGRTGRPLAPPVALPAWSAARTHLGWHAQPDGRWFLGLPIPSGRLRDTETSARRRAVREILDHHAEEIRLTPDQDLLLCGIAGTDRPAVEAILDDLGVPRAEHLSLSAVSAMACPALPTCGQALGEAERVLPEVVDLLDRLLGERGLHDVAIETRMTGCPNGCSRPYVAELGIVGRTKTAYDLFVGGDPAGTRLATELVRSVPLVKLGDVLAPLLDRYRTDRLDGEAFGDWANRRGVERLRTGLPTFEGRR